MAARTDITTWGLDTRFMFSAADEFPSSVGQYINITGGSGWTPGYYQIQAYFPAFDTTNGQGTHNLIQISEYAAASSGITTGGQGDIVASAPLAGGNCTAAAKTTTGITISWTDSTGINTPIVNHLWRGENINGTTNLTDLGVVSTTASSYTDTTAVAQHYYRYYIQVTDSTAATANGSPAASYIADNAPMKLLVVGDSNYGAGVTGRTTDTALQIAAQLPSVLGLRSVTMTNKSMGGAGLWNFLPASAPFAGIQRYDDMVTGANAAGCNLCFLIHGFNDASAARTKAQYKADLITFTTNAFEDIPTLEKIILGFCFGHAYTGTDTTNALITQYHDAQREVANGTTIRLGNQATFRFLFENTGLSPFDGGVHLNDAGCIAIGAMHAQGIVTALNYAGGSGGGGGNGSVFVSC